MARTWNPPDERTWSQLLSEVAGVEKLETQIAKEYNLTEVSIHRQFQKHKESFNHRPRCIGQGTIFGCYDVAAYPLWLIPWVELRKDGVRVEDRSNQRYWVDSCLNCVILEQSKRRQRKTAWVKRASKNFRKSSAHARSIYESEFELLQDILQPHREISRSYHFNWRENEPLVYTFSIGDQGVFVGTEELSLVNIDTTGVRDDGLVRLTYG